MIKPTKRKAFNFLRSYFDVYNELQNDKDRLSFLNSIINKQFLDEDPKDLNFLVNLCYESQRHSIETSVKGWKRATNDTLGTTPPTPLGTTPPTNPKEEEEEEEEEEEYTIDFESLLNIINKYGNRSFKVMKDALKKKYKKLLKDGYTKQQVINAIINAHKEDRHKETNFKYLTPEFFSRSEKIDMYGMIEVKKAPPAPNTEPLFD